MPNARITRILLFFLMFSLISICSAKSVYAAPPALYPAYIEKGEPVLWGLNEDTHGVRYWGYVDRTGRFVIPPQYDEAGDFNIQGYAQVTTTSHASILINTLGRQVPNSSQGTPSGITNAGLIPFSQNPSKPGDNAHYGYRSAKDGSVVIPACYLMGQPFQDGYAVVATAEKGNSWKQGVIDASGKVMIPLVYNRVDGYGNGHFIGEVVTSKGTVHYLLNTSGKRLLAMSINNVVWYDTRWFCTWDAKGNLKLIDWSGHPHSLSSSITRGVKAEVLPDGVVRYDNGVFLTYLDTDGSILWSGSDRQIWPDGLQVRTEMRMLNESVFMAVSVMTGYDNVKLQKTVNEEIEAFGVVTANQYKAGYPAVGDMTATHLGGLGVFNSKGLYGKNTEQDRWMKTLHLNLRTGKVYSLTDLLVKDKPVLDKLASIGSTTPAAFSIPDKWLSQNSVFNNVSRRSLPDSQRFDVRSADGFELMEEGIVFFKYYDGVHDNLLGEFAEIYIPFAWIDNLIDKSGELWQLMKTGSTKGIGREPLLPSVMKDNEGNHLSYGYKDRMNQWIIGPLETAYGFLGKADYAYGWLPHMEVGAIDRSGKVYPLKGFHQISILGSHAFGDRQDFQDDLIDIPSGKVLATAFFRLASEGRPPEWKGGLLPFGNLKSDKKASFGFMDTTGKIVIQPIYRDFRQSPDGRDIVVQTSDGKFCRIDQNGRLINRYGVTLDLARGYLGTNLVYVNGKGKRGILDVHGKIVITAQYDKMYMASPNRFIAVSLEKATGKNRAFLLTETGINLTGKIYSELSYLDGGVFLGKTSTADIFLLNLQGNVIRKLPTEGLIRGMDNFKGGLAAFRSGDHILVLRTDGSIVGRFVPPEVDIAKLKWDALLLEHKDGVLIWHGSEVYTPKVGVIIPGEKYLREKLSYASEDGLLYPVQDSTTEVE